MARLLRNLGALAGGGAEGYLAGARSLREQRALDLAGKRGQRERDELNLKVDKAARERAMYEEISGVFDEWLSKIGNRNPAAVGAAAGAAAANPLGAVPSTPMLTAPAGNAPGLEAQQASAPTAFITQTKRAPRTLPFAYDDLGS